MTRLIDADKLCEKFKERQRAALRWKEKAILDGDEEKQIRADATLAFLSEVKLTIDNAPTVDTDLSKYSDKLWKEAYERGKNERPHGKWKYIIPDINKIGYFVCPFCGNNPIITTNFCSHCGADMRGKKNV